ncbi:hypothetical protein KAR91_12475 [Candidatus Pacearchaeota archaeon]|nr:hypothetical protein [Candidatus Pacearchaeota archaeon]
MGLDIYIKDIREVPKHLRADLREDRPMHQSLHGDIGDNEQCLVYRLGKRSAARPIFQDMSEKAVASVIESFSPRYTIFMRSKKAFEQLSDSTPIHIPHIPGGSPHFENVGELKKDIKQAEKNRFRIVYETEADGIEKTLQSTEKTR